MQNITDAQVTPHRPQRLSRPRGLVACAALVVVVTGLVAACGEDDAPTPAASDVEIPTAQGPEPDATPVTAPHRPAEPPASPKPPPAPEPTPAPQPVPAARPTPAAELDDGRHFGYLVAYEIDGSGTVARFDLAQFFTGDEADAAAAEDGVIDPGGEVENDHHIRNTNDRLRRVVFRDDADVTVVDCTSGCTDVTADRVTLQSRPTPTPVWLTIGGGVVVRAEEQYLP